MALGLSVFHVMEPEIKAQIDPAVYKEHLELMEAAADQMALALRNAQIYEAQRRLADRQPQPRRPEHHRVAGKVDWSYPPRDA